MSINNSDFRLDAGEGLFFTRQLESIDQRVYEVRYPDLKARNFVTIVSDVQDWQDSYTWREMDQKGKAKVIASGADDLPRADVFKTETTQVIKDLGVSYGYTVKEIKKASALGINLDASKAMAARRAIDELIDELLAFGDSDLGLQGFTDFSSVDDTYSLTNSFATAAAGTDTQKKLLVDEVMAFASTRHEATEERWGSFRLLLPTVQYNILDRMPFGDNADRTALQYILQNSSHITDIQSWNRLTTAGTGSTTRMILQPNDPAVAGGIVPMEYTPFPVQQKNLEYVVPVMAACGGCVCRYPVAMAYADGI